MGSRIILTQSMRQGLDKDKSKPKVVIDYVKSVCANNSVAVACSKCRGQISYCEYPVAEKTYYVVFLRGEVDDDEYLCFRGIFSDFKEFKDYTKQLENRSFTEEELGEIGIIQGNNEIFQQKMPLPESMKIDGKLEFKWQNQYVYEMEEWIHSIPKYDKKLSSIFDCLSDIIVSKKFDDYGFDNEGLWRIVKLKDLYIIFAEIKDGEKTFYYLFDIRDNSDISDLKDRYVISYSELEHHCKKGYPCVMLCGDEKIGFQ